MSTITALDLINGALRLLQVKSSDVVLTNEEANDALDALNLMIDSWSIDNLMLYHITKESFTLTANHQPHTIGTSGDFNTARPIVIEAATVTINGTDFGVMPIQYDDWAAIKLKSLSTSYTEYLYLDATYPLGNIYLYPISTAASSITLYCRKALTQLTSLTDTFSLPPGYARALKFNLALDLAPEYQTSAGDDVTRIARESKAAIKRVNNRPLTTQIDAGLMVRNKPSFNVYRGS